ncbi:hypothetical protein [Deinococcus pimensis]|uniref:hypothetical protein n=1 Tax=Deinococcus pimensis TaxID=309888 RepID=UPI0004842C40|nr:hypothetical protein [Deinococcus pimensis]
MKNPSVNAATALLFLVVSPAVSAAPSGAPTSSTMTLSCAGVPVTVTVNSGRAGEHVPSSFIWNPGHVDGGGVGVPLALTAIVTDASGAVLFQSAAEKGRTADVFEGKSTTCEVTQTDPDSGISVHLTGEVLFRGR